MMFCRLWRWLKDRRSIDVHVREAKQEIVKNEQWLLLAAATKRRRELARRVAMLEFHKAQIDGTHADD